MIITIVRARAYLLTVFLTGLLIHSIALIYAYLRPAIYPETLTQLLIKILGIYSIHFAIIFGGIFGQSVTKTQKASKAIFWIAFSLAILWNLLLVWRTVVFSFASEDSSLELSKYLEEVSKASSFLVAGALAFFFANKE